MSKKLIYYSFFLILFFGIRGDGSCAFAGEKEERDLEYKVKAAFIFNFARLIDWPPHAFTDDQQPFILCVVGEDPFGSAFAGIESKKIKDRCVQLRKYRYLSEVDQCHIMFVDQKAETGLARYLAEHEKSALVTVGDSEGFVGKGGIIEFCRRGDGKLSFKINNGAAKKRQLYLGASLLDLAAEVY